MSFSLDTCTPYELAHYLQTHRFATTTTTTNGNNTNDIIQTASFLMQAVATLPNHNNAQDNQTSDRNNTNEDTRNNQQTLPSALHDVDLGDNLLIKESIEVSCLVPRGKFQITFTSHGIQLVDNNNKKTERNKILLSCHNDTRIQQGLVFPKPEDCQTGKGTDLVLLVFEQHDIDDDDNSNSDKKRKALLPTYKGKPLHQLCFQLPGSLPLLKQQQQQSDDEDGEEDPDDDKDSTTPVILDHSDQWIKVMVRALSPSLCMTQIARVANPSKPSTLATQTIYQFVSHQDDTTSTTTGGLPFVRCNYKVADGVLFPLKQGILFFKPPLFIPRQSMASIATCGRGATGTSSNRYMDVQVMTDDKRMLEFGNIHRSEHSVLQQYIHGVLIPAMEQDNNMEQQLYPMNDLDKVGKENKASVTVERRKDTANGNGSGTSTRIARKATLVAREATKRELVQGDDGTAESEEEEDDEYHEHASEDSEENDDDDDNEDSDNDSEEEDFEQANDGDTESEEDSMSSPPKKARMVS